MDALRTELRRVAALALPVAATQVGTMLLGFVDMLLLGRVSTEALAASAIANVWIYGTTQLALGTIFGLDPIVAQAHGAGRGDVAGRALQRGLVLALLLSIPVALAWFGCERFLVWSGQDPELARMAQRYTLVQIPSIPFFLAFQALRQYLQGREMVRPALFVMALANVVNAVLAWLLIFGGLGFPALGLEGAGIATGITRIACFAILLWWVVSLRLYAGAWVPWSRAAFAWQGLREILRLGVPVGFQTSLEVWAFSGAALIAGHLGAAALAAHSVVLNMASLAFMLPLGVGLAASTRVGNLLGARRPQDAQRAAWVAMALGAGVMMLSALLFVVGRHWLPRIYTTEADVIALATGILPIAAAFQIFDGTQVVGCGVLRGMGRTRPAAWFNLLGYWVIGLPLGGWLALRAGFGLGGIWWGLAIGLAIVSTLLILWIHRRGPARTAQLVGVETS